jgi:hypothetical protein
VSGPVDVLAVLCAVADVLAENGITEMPADLRKARAAVAELIAADDEYDAAVTAHKELIRRIAEQGWYELEADALRKAGERTMRAMSRRTSALARIGGAP